MSRTFSSYELQNKYRPESLKDMIGDYLGRSVNSYLQQFGADGVVNSPNLMIKGESGIGKTLSAVLAIKRNGFYCHKFDVETLHKSAAFASKNKKKGEVRTDDFYYKVASYDLPRYSSIPVDDRKRGTYHQKAVLLIDPLDAITKINDKKYIKNLLKANNDLKIMPIIVIASVSHKKHTNEISELCYFLPSEGSVKKKDKRYNIIPPQLDKLDASQRKLFDEYRKKNMLKLLDHIVITEGIEVCDEIRMKIVEQAGGDIRKIFDIVSNLIVTNMTNGNGLTELTKDSMDSFLNISMRKELAVNINTQTLRLLNGYEGYETIIKDIYAKDRATIPLLFSRNATKSFAGSIKKFSKRDIVDAMCLLNECWSKADMVDGILYSSQSWDLQEVHGFWGCVAPSYLMSNYDRRYRVQKVDYTQDYHLSSFTMGSQKKFNNVCAERRFAISFRIQDQIHMSSIVNRIFNEYNSLVAKKKYSELSDAEQQFCQGIVKMFIGMNICLVENIMQDITQKELKKKMTKSKVKIPTLKEVVLKDVISTLCDISRKNKIHPLPIVATKKSTLGSIMLLVNEIIKRAS